jgi:Uma2 family endonuclease
MAIEHPHKVVTLADFEQFVLLPENSGRLFELVDGEIREMSPGRTSYSGLRDIVTVEAHLFCRQHNLPCYTSGEAGAYNINGHIVVPDFAYKRTPLSDDYPDPEPPLWVVEVISPTDKAGDISDKRRIYIEAGILLWEVYKPTRRIDVYAPGQPPRLFGMEDMLDAGDVLPGFKLAVKTLFES